MVFIIQNVFPKMKPDPFLNKEALCYAYSKIFETNKARALNLSQALMVYGPYDKLLGASKNHEFDILVHLKYVWKHNFSKYILL